MSVKPSFIGVTPFLATPELPSSVLVADIVVADTFISDPLVNAGAAILPSSVISHDNDPDIDIFFVLRQLKLSARLPDFG